jgi:hypothetical protein
MTRYRALVDLTYPTDPEIIARLLAGDFIPPEKRGPVRNVTAGEIVDDIPETSIRGLLQKGRVEEVGPTARTRRPRSAPEEEPAEPEEES